jgi:hypothetical protein
MTMQIAPAAWPLATRSVRVAEARVTLRAAPYTSGYGAILPSTFHGSNHSRLGELVGPGVDDRMAINVVDAGHDSLLEFVL